MKCFPPKSQTSHQLENHRKKRIQCIVQVTAVAAAASAAKSLQLVRLCATPQTAAPPSLGFSRQEHEWVSISFSNA